MKPRPCGFCEKGGQEALIFLHVPNVEGTMPGWEVEVSG